MDVLLLIIGMILVGCAVALLLFAGYLRIRRKGYRPPGATLILLAAFALGILAAMRVSNALPSNEKSVRAFFAIFCVPVLVATVTTTLFIWLGPRRNPRVAGRRRPRFPFATSGWTLIGLAAAFCIFTIEEWAVGRLKIENPIRILRPLFYIWSFFGGLGAYLICLGRRVKAQVSIEDVVRNDARAPVLYLRPFNMEWLPFVFGPKSRYGDYVRGIQRFTMTLGKDPDPNVSVRFEEYFAATLTARIGPFVALGNPEDYTPTEGAVRTYVKDTGWKEHVKRLAGRCSCIVAEAASSDNLRWEFKYLRQEGLLQKLFVITRPVLAKPPSWPQKLFFRLKGVRPDTWRDFAENLATLGYDIPREPVAGAVITFDVSGKGSTLTTGAHSPEDYIEPIRTFIIDSLGYSPQRLDASPCVAEA
jgi:hypothetical protein